MKLIKKIFSLRNRYRFENQHKILYILGIKVSFKNPFGRYKFRGENNCILFSLNGNLEEPQTVLKNLNILIRGNNNTIIIDKNYLKKNLLFSIYIEGSNNRIKIGKTKSIHGSINILGNKSTFELNDTEYDININAYMGQRVSESIVDNNYNTIIIDKNCSIGEVTFFVCQKNTSVTIGKDCMLSDGIKIQSHDGHKILDENTGELINNGKNNVKIGNHVWVGRSCTILKNAEIADNSIIGCSSVVTRKFKQKNVILAGNPAKIIKTNINWDRESYF